MKSWIKLSAAGLAASLLLACGGGGDTDPGGVTPLSQLQPGERFAMETPLLPSGSQLSHYVVHGVTPEGVLVESDRPGLLAGVRVPVLESVTRDGRSSTSVANPDTLKQQQAFYQQLWNSTAEHEGTRDPQAILAEIDDLDTRIVDLMDDVAASGVKLKEYLAFYDRLDAIPELAGKELAELNLREALSDLDKVSVLKPTPAKCPDGQILVISQSRLFSYCRVQRPPTWKALAALPTKAGNPLAELPEPSVSAVLAENDSQALILAVARDRKFAMEAQLHSQQKEFQEAQKRAAQLLSALSQNRNDDQKWKTYCAQHPDLRCVSSDTPNFGAVMAQRVQEMLDAMQSTSQMDMLRIQALISRWNEAMDMISNLLRKMQDAKLAVTINMR
ncbi:hypothetical protein [Acidovorax sp.]|uniref:hypothetical protein n=1 Tax=Acidovorax sp. TaxID=1872122 RepID=UPI0027B9F50E|nr:hypothetical protein [Acidovorax sp.]